MSNDRDSFANRADGSNDELVPDPSEIAPSLDPSEPADWREVLFGPGNRMWLALMAVGFLLFEFTAQPSIVAVAVCSKFGIADVRNGFWLRRRDPAKNRGKVCFWFCVSRGLWKTTAVAFVAMIAITILDAGRGNAPGHLRGTAMTFTFGFVLASFTTFAGGILGRVAGIRVWLDRGLTDARETDAFPPPEAGFNSASFLVAASMILPIAIVLVLVGFFVRARPNAIRNAIGFLLGLFVIPVGIISAGLAIGRSVIAPKWGDCWDFQPVRTGRTLRDVAIEAGAIKE